MGRKTLSMGLMIWVLSPGGPRLGAQQFEDCNRNGIPDSRDIATGTSADCNGNRRPDECDIALPNECLPGRLCVFDGFSNRALGAAQLSLEVTDDGREVLLVSNIGSSGRDGVGQEVPDTREMETALAAPNFSRSQEGARLTTTQIGIVGGRPNQRFAALTVMSVGDRLRVEGDFSFIGTTSYALHALLGSDLVAVEQGLRTAVFEVPLVDIRAVDSRLVRVCRGGVFDTEPCTTDDDCCDGACVRRQILSFHLFSPAVLVIPGRGEVEGDHFDIIAEDFEQLPTAQTEIQMLAANTGPLLITAQRTVPPPGSGDCNGNGVPDECDADENGNGTPDECEPHRCGGLAFSTEQDFLTRGPVPPDGNPIISGGDLLNLEYPGLTGASVCARNGELLRAFCIREDLGLDAAVVLDEEGSLIAFSTELDDPFGRFTAGDLLISNGTIIRNAVLLAGFDVPPELDLGLDALEFVGDTARIVEFVERVAEAGGALGIEDRELFLRLLRVLELDILFSTEGTAPTIDAPKFLDGDLLSALTGVIAVSGMSLLAPLPAGVPLDGVDYGLDAFTFGFDRENGAALDLFSTEIVSLDRASPFTDGDALEQGPSVFLRNRILTSALEPVVSDVGLDALNLMARRPSLPNLVVGGGQLPGDCNQDGVCDVSDVACYIGILFSRLPFSSSTFPPCTTQAGNLAVLDINGDGRLDISDLSYKANFLFSGGPGPVQGLNCIRVNPALGCPDSCP